LDPFPKTRFEPEDARTNALYKPLARSGAAEGLVYDLRRGESTSDAYFVEVACFADAVVEGVELRAGPLLASYRQHVTETLREDERSGGEYALDLLTLGLALTRYLGAAENTPGWVMAMAQEFFWLRWESSRLKPVFSLLRALLCRYFLAPKIGCAPAKKPYKPQDLIQLINWLQAAGEFEPEIRRLNNWHSFLSTMARAEAGRAMETAAEVSDWFAPLAEQALGAYTPGVARFLAKDARSGFRQDYFFIAKAPVEYHLAMVAAEIMNSGLRETFAGAPHKVVLLPACLRGALALNCQARQVANELICAGCSPDCAVNRITNQMRGLGIKAFMAPPAVGFGFCLQRGQHEPNTGVIAVACLAKVLPVVYQMRARRIPAQCLALDFPGCQKHWRKMGIASELNEARLVQLVAGSPRQPSARLN
jgi:hypothetical protein